MANLKLPHLRLGWLEPVTVAALLSLLFQLFPSLWWNLLACIDPRGWSAATWLTLNALGLLGLLVVRFGISVERLFQTRGASVAKHSESRSADVDERVQRAAEWCERAKKRLPWH